MKIKVWYKKKKKKKKKKLKKLFSMQHRNIELSGKEGVDIFVLFLGI